MPGEHEGSVWEHPFAEHRTLMTETVHHHSTRHTRNTVRKSTHEELDMSKKLKTIFLFLFFLCVLCSRNVECSNSTFILWSLF